MGAVEFLVGPAGIDDHRHVRPVDSPRASRYFSLSAQRAIGVLPSRKYGAEKNAVFLPLERHRHPAHRDVEVAGGEIARQIRPAGRDEFDLDPERRAERLGRVDVEPRVAAVARRGR